MPTIFRTLAAAEMVAGPLGTPSKMPGYAYGLSAKMCNVGSVLQKVKGSVCHKCYAMKGHYNNKSVQEAHAKRMNGIYHPLWVDAMVFMIQYRKCDYFRWHDSGDIMSLQHLKKIVDVCRQTPKTKHWLPTREQDTVKRFLEEDTFPSNLVVRMSAMMIDGPPPTGFQTTSTVVKENWTCPSSEQNNSCGACRACWDPSVANVAYKKH